MSIYGSNDGGCDDAIETINVFTSSICATEQELS